MSEIVKRVEEALQRSIEDELPVQHVGDVDGRPIYAFRLDLLARAAIAAMSKPTEAMEIAAGRDYCSDDHYDPLRTWQIMIATALK